MKHLPNLITVFRILLVVPIMILLAREQYGVVLVLFLVAAFSDALDGYLARRYQWQSWLGAVLDPVADKLMLVGGYLVLGWLGWLPLWLVALVILRDGVILTGALAYRWLCGALEMAPSQISKINTVLQMGLGVLVILVANGLMMPPWLLHGVILAVALTTVWSGADYVRVWSRRARYCRQEGNHA